MTKKLSKITKKVARKQKNGVGLHEKSRDAQRLRRAVGRTEKLAKQASLRTQLNQPYVQRIAFFQGAAKVTTDVLDLDDLQRLVDSYIERGNEGSKKKTGRPSSTREDLLQQRLDAEKREWDSGYWIPDLRDRSTVEDLQNWEGDWNSLAVFSFIRLRKDSTILPSSFPPKGKS